MSKQYIAGVVMVLSAMVCGYSFGMSSLKRACIVDDRAQIDCRVNKIGFTPVSNVKEHIKALRDTLTMLTGLIESIDGIDRALGQRELLFSDEQIEFITVFVESFPDERCLKAGLDEIAQACEWRLALVEQQDGEVADFFGGAIEKKLQILLDNAQEYCLLMRRAHELQYGE